MLKTAIDGEINLTNRVDADSDVVMVEGDMSLNNLIDGESGLRNLMDGDEEGFVPVTTSDHDKLRHRDYVDQHPISAITGLEERLDSISLHLGNSAYWDSQRLYIPKRGEIVVYTDYATTVRYGQRVKVPNIKIGDGTAYLIDLPFVGDDLRDRIGGTNG